MALDLAASFDEVQVGRSRRQEPWRDAQLRGQRLHHLRVLVGDESPESLLLPTKRPFSRGGKLVWLKLIRAVVSWPAVHCDSRSPSPRPAARHLDPRSAERRGQETLAERIAERQGLAALPEPAQQMR